jgi:hypothetical protein
VASMAREMTMCDISICDVVAVFLKSVTKPFLENMSGMMAGGWKRSPSEEMEEAQRIHLCREALPCINSLPVLSFSGIVISDDLSFSIVDFPAQGYFWYSEHSHTLTAHGHFRNFSILLTLMTFPAH